jgi:hypothetical protein
MKASGIIVAALDSEPSAIEAWNSWYDLDHLPPNVALPGIMSGRRYVCTPPLHALRSPGNDPWLAERASSFLTVYTLCGPVNETFAAMVSLREELDAAGRMFAEELKVVRGGDGLTLERMSGAAHLHNDADELPLLGHAGLLLVRARDRRYSAEDHESLAAALLSFPGCLAALSYRSDVVAGTGLHLVLLNGDVIESAGNAAAALDGLGGFSHSAYQAIAPLDYGWADGLRAAGLPATGVAAPA